MVKKENKVSISNTTAILVCNCKNEYQDKHYGKNNRVHNWGRKSKGGVGGWRCTVCKKIK